MPFDEPVEQQDEAAMLPLRFGYPLADDEDGDSRPSIGMRIMQMAPAQASAAETAPLRGIDGQLQQAAKVERQIQATPSIGQRIMQIGNQGVPAFDIQDGRPVWRQDPQTLTNPNIGQRILQGAWSGATRPATFAAYQPGMWGVRPEPLSNLKPSETPRPGFLPNVTPGQPPRPQPLLNNLSNSYDRRSIQSGGSTSVPGYSGSSDQSIFAGERPFAGISGGSGLSTKSASRLSDSQENLRGPLDFNEFASFLKGKQQGSVGRTGGILASATVQGSYPQGEGDSAETLIRDRGATEAGGEMMRSVARTPASGSSERSLQKPALKGTVGGKSAKNDPGDVAKIQEYLNAVVRDGELPGFTELKVTGKVDDVMLRMIYEYQKQAHLLASPRMTPAEVMIEPGRGTVTTLARHPFIDKRWSHYDDAIKNEVAKYNGFFSKYPGFVPLDWRWVKAMIWGRELKAGPDERKGRWWTRPMQIGNPGDPALDQLRAGNEGSGIFVDDKLRKQLKTQPVVGDLNIKAGIAWLYTKLIKSLKHESVIDNPALKTYELKPRQSLQSLVQKKNGKQILKTTLEELYRENGLNQTTAKSRRPGPLKYREAHEAEYIESLNDWNTATQNYHRRVPKPDEPPYLPEIREAYERIKKNWPQ